MIGSPSVIRNEGYRALVQVLGAAGTIVFLRQFDNGSGNYTDDRRAMVEANTVDTIAGRIRNRNEQNTQEM